MGHPSLNLGEKKTGHLGKAFMRSPISCPFLPILDVIFGFTRTLTTVSEMGTEELCVEIFNPGMEESLNLTLLISLEPIFVSAGNACICYCTFL